MCTNQIDDKIQYVKYVPDIEIKYDNLPIHNCQFR